MSWQRFALVIHHTAGSQFSSIETVRADQMRRGYADYAYHWGIVVDKATGRGHLKTGRPPSLQGCHGNAHYNKVAFGLCVHGDYSKYAPSEALYQDILAAVKHVITKHGIAPGKVIGHRDIRALRPGEKTTATACPGGKFPLARLLKDLQA